MNWEREMYQERSWTWTLNPGSKASGCVEEFRLQEHYLAVQQKSLYQSRWRKLSHSGGCSVQVLRLWIRNKCMLKICSLLVYLSNLDIHISMRLTQLMQTDRKATEKTNNKQACTNLKRSTDGPFRLLEHYTIRGKEHVPNDVCPMDEQTISIHVNIN